MKKPLNIKKFLLPNIPYVFIALFATKLGQAARLSPGADFSGKALHLMEGFAAAFQSALPSFHPIDLCVGVAAALLIRLIVYVKGKNAKKFRKNLEYGSARWGKPEDIAPYVDPKFENNVILTQTERLMMSNRPKDPKTARNKNVLVVGGSGSGKTRFFIKFKQKSHFADCLTEQTLDFVLHRLFCGLAEMDTDEIGCLADLLSDSRASGGVGCGIVHSKSSCK